MAEDKNNKGKVLVAEDETPMAKALSIKLEKAGFEVDIANNGEEALQALEANGYDVLLLDLVMPKVDGFTVLKKMKDKSMNIPTIVLSNLGQKSDIEKTSGYGVVDHFVKSNTPIVNVVSYVEKALSK